jgi:riboflavin transporter FmnP
MMIMQLWWPTEKLIVDAAKPNVTVNVWEAHHMVVHMVVVLAEEQTEEVHHKKMVHMAAILAVILAVILAAILAVILAAMRHQEQSGELLEWPE